MSDLSSRDGATKGINHIPIGLGLYVDSMPNEKQQQTPPNKKKKPPKLPMPDSEMHLRMSMFFGDSLNKGKKKDSWKWFNFCNQVLRLQNPKNIWDKSIKHYYDAIEKHAEYDDDVVRTSDNKSHAVPTLTKSGMYFILSQEVNGLWPDTSINRQTARILLEEFIAEDTSNVANGVAKTSSSAPMRQSCSPVQVQNPSAMQVLAVCVRLITRRTQPTSRRQTTR